MTGSDEAAVAARVAAVEDLLGDPGDPGNPTGAAAVLAADERAEMLAEGERLLHGHGIAAEFVPTALGGRLDRVDALARVLRPVFRRDATLGLGFGATSVLAAANVWFGGRPEQRERTARLLLAGGRVAVAHQGSGRGGDFVRSSLTADRTADGYTLRGVKPVVNNGGRAGLLVLFARTEAETGPHDHCALLLDPARTEPGRYRVLPRRRMTGMRGLEAVGLAFAGQPAPADRLLGAPGTGVGLAQRSFQLTRSLLPSMAIASADTCLRTALSFAVGRSRYGRPLLRTPAARAAMDAAFVDLLIADSLALVATRAAHLLPTQTSVLAAAVRYLLPRLLRESTYDLSVVLGARVFDRSGPYGLFQKNVRDLPVISLGHAGNSACLATLVPQLARLLERPPMSGEPAPAELFRPRGPLPGLDLDRLVPAARHDALAASLAEGTATLRSLAAVPGAPAATASAAALAGTVVRELRELPGRLAGAPDGHPGVFAAADRYVLVLAAAACLGVWQHERTAPDPASPDGFLADPGWLAPALARIVRRLGHPAGELPRACADHVHRELLDRFASLRSFDLYDTPLAG
ncbi:alkylation response protein AidB-like acyl-CoA dehydrogenase [Kitasatospora sp. SolWspMP-SS2h]|uniref:acyl-CoA dehydrogenase n=1 Tax=Kitasatospora sp. SolWspMP-SS2h TaxID=1305729 RepID=UPI000DBF4BA0|nr:acyl-CoA dehydrogenase [Kitasatospora sp. SolWspMP-SS2h]RAJ39638.1 alkylation response protein AidB-like acyl-CoA dehydrogenase [Kitasatospora sp. SolWspMP-SS2h]